MLLISANKSSEAKEENFQIFTKSQKKRQKKIKSYYRLRPKVTTTKKKTNENEKKSEIYF